MVEVTHYLPALTVVVCSLLAGVIGLIAVMVMRPRVRPVDHYVDPAS